MVTGLRHQVRPDADLSGRAAKRRYSAHAVTLLTIYMVIRLFIPSVLVLAPLGGAGSPATILAACLAGWYLLLWLHPGALIDRGRQPVRAAAVLFAAVIVTSYIVANLRPLPGLEQNAADRGLIFLAGWLGVLFLAADAISTWERLEVLLRRVVACVSGVALIGIGQFITGLNLATYVVIPGLTTKVPYVDLSSRDGINRPAATAAHPLEFAALLALALPIALHQARFAAPGSRLWKWLQAATIATAMPLTVSRSAALAIAVIAIGLIPSWPRRDRRAAYAVIATGVTLLWAALPNMVSLFYQLFSQVGSESSSASRVEAYSAAVPFIAQHPWFGRGFATFLPQTYFFVDNQYLTSLIETGIVGVLALAGLFATAWSLARRARRLVTDDRTRDLLQSLAISVAAGAVSFATFDALSFASATGLTFLIFGCTGAAWRLARNVA